MNLSDFSRYIDPAVVHRGKEYASEGRVISLKSIADEKYTAVVRGYEDYEVYVRLDNENNIMESECDCPYDFGPVCKHQVAVFLELKNREADGVSSPEPSLQQLLEAESKEKLIELLLSIASDSYSAEERIRLHLSKRGADQELDACRRLIRSYIDTYSDDHGFVSWRNVSRAVEGAEIVAEKALSAFDEEEWLHGLAILFCIIEEMIELLQSADDSDGGVGIVIESCLESIFKLAQDHHHIPAEERLKIFRRLLEETHQPYYDGWSDWQLALLEAAGALIESEQMQHQWDDAADSLLGHTSGSNWSREYTDERVTVLRYGQILERSGEEQAKAYLYKHLHFPEIREIAIRAALEQGDAEEAIRLAEAGEAQDQRLPGLVYRWKKYRYEAYHRTGQVEQQRKLGMELIVNGEYAYYRSVKDTFSDEGEWTLYLQDMLDQLEQSPRGEHTYTQILVEEEMYARLLEHVRKAPYRIESFYEQLLPHYPEEVKALFVAYIEFRADQSRDRRDYADVCRIIRMLQQVGGQKEAFTVTQKLLTKFPRRPAFREELGKIRF